MSTPKSKRGGGNASTSLSTIGRGGASVKSRNHPSSARPFSRKPRKGVDDWGYTPTVRRDQKGLTLLFDEQRRLNRRLLVQSKLLKVAKTEVRSVEAEHLRMVNQAILDTSSHVEGFSNPFSVQNLSDAQLLVGDMLKRQGQTAFPPDPEGRVVPTPSPPSVRRRRKKPDTTKPSYRVASHEDVIRLRGPLLRYYRRAVERGYKGSPEAWLRGPNAVSLYEKLRRKGFTLPHPETWDCSSPRSPLRWTLNQCSAQQQLAVRRGFQAERLNRNATNMVVLRRQAASVQRLKLSDWPCAGSGQGRSWPNYPTLGESWTMARRGKVPTHYLTSLEALGFTSGFKRTARQVKPGASSRVISKLVLGVRADVEVPRKFLAYFRYRWGFLILNRQTNLLPKGLVKHLADLWKKDISRMFLKYPVRYNEALRRLPARTCYVLAGFVPAGTARRPDKSKRRRTGKYERLREKLAELLRFHSNYGNVAPTPERSDDGVRLC